MKENKNGELIGKISFIVVSLFILGLGIILAIEDNTIQYLGDNVISCFDHYGNEMVNQSCISEIYGCGKIQILFNICEKNYPLDLEYISYQDAINNNVK